MPDFRGDHFPDAVHQERERLNRSLPRGVPFIDALALSRRHRIAATILRSPATVHIPLTRYHHGSLGAAIAQLEAKHVDGRYWYRGQRRSFSTTYHTQINDWRPRALTITFEGTIPTYFRQFTEGRFPGLGSHIDPLTACLRALTDDACSNPELRETLASFLHTVPFFVVQLAIQDWILTFDNKLTADGTNIFEPQHRLISLSQHYGYHSIMVDVSRSIDVAVWFATHDWTTGTIRGFDEPGVIYRFDRDAVLSLHDAICANDSARDIRCYAQVGLADISSCFDPALRRPWLQQGGSLYGFENASVYAYLAEHNGMEAHYFPHTTVRPEDLRLTADNIRPNEDDGNRIFRVSAPFSSEPLSLDEFERVLTRLELEPDRQRHLTKLRRAMLI